MPSVHLDVEGAGALEPLVLEDPQVVVAGFTGRDEAEVRAHIAELGKLGVQAPSEVPAFFHLPSSALRVTPTVVVVHAPATSGEAEPVLIRLASGETFVGVGSDHTDRDAERESLDASKRACPKLLGPRVWPFAQVADNWDELVLSGHTGDAGDLYQRAPLATLREPADVLGRLTRARLDADRPLVTFLGTVALVDGFRFDDAFRATLSDTRRGRELVCAYQIRSDRANTSDPQETP